MTYYEFINSSSFDTMQDEIASKHTVSDILIVLNSYLSALTDGYSAYKFTGGEVTTQEHGRCLNLKIGVYGKNSLGKYYCKVAWCSGITYFNNTDFSLHLATGTYDSAGGSATTIDEGSESDTYSEGIVFKQGSQSITVKDTKGNAYTIKYGYYPRDTNGDGYLDSCTFDAITITKLGTNESTSTDFNESAQDNIKNGTDTGSQTINLNDMSASVYKVADMIAKITPMLGDMYEMQKSLFQSMIDIQKKGIESNIITDTMIQAEYRSEDEQGKNKIQRSVQAHEQLHSEKVLETYKNSIDENVTIKKGLHANTQASKIIEKTHEEHLAVHSENQSTAQAAEFEQPKIELEKADPAKYDYALSPEELEYEHICKLNDLLEGNITEADYQLWCSANLTETDYVPPVTTP
jgi:hypothetical protein